MTPAYFYGTEWEGAHTAYIALMFEVGIEVPGDRYYGWLHVTVGSDLRGDFITLHGFGFENTPNVGIEVAQIPEPSTALLAVGGAAGLLFARRVRHRTVS